MMTEFSSVYSVPGTVITNTEDGFLRGHGTQLVDSEEGGTVLSSTVAGVVHRVNKLLSVKPVKARFIGEVGDLVIGRIIAVDSKRWKVDIAGWKDAVLQLSSVTLPGGVQRMRTYEDALQMRSLFKEADLISAEIQNVSSDGTISLHTRSLRYGKLENGAFVMVPSKLMRRLPQHYISLPYGLDVILGKNGNIWITRSIPEEWKMFDQEDDATPLAETLQRQKQRHAQTPLTPEERTAVCRLRNCVLLLAHAMIEICPDSMCTVYDRSEEQGVAPKDILAGLPGRAAEALIEGL
jgi:exosome complex component RRP4